MVKKKIPEDSDLEVKCAIPWLREWSNQKIYKNKALKEFFTYKGVSLWWMMEFYLYGTSIFFESYKNIIINTEKGIPISIQRSRIKPYIQVYYKLFRFLLRKYTWKLLELFDKRPKSKKKKILMLSEYAWGPILDHITEKRKIDDKRFSPVISQLKKQGKYDVTVSDVPIGFQLRLKHFTNRLGRFAKYPPFERYIAPSDFLAVIELRNKLLKQYLNVKTKINFKYKDIDLRDLMEPKLTFFFSTYIVEILLFFKAISRMLEVEKPSIVVLSSEVTPFGRIAVALSRLKQLKVTAIQHGTHLEPIDFYKNKKDISYTKKVTAPYCPIPDISFVYGIKNQRYLIEHSKYKKEWISLVGNVAYDSLPYYLKDCNKEILCKRFKLDPNKKLIFLASVPFYKDDDQKNFLNIAYESFKNLDNANLIVKIHPNDKNSKLHHQIAKKLKIENIKIVKDADIFELLCSSDLVITGYSTSVIDAQVFKKPTIVIDVTNDMVAQEFIKTKAVIGASNKGEAISGINNLLYNKYTIKKINRYREKFLKEYLFSVGDSSKKIIDYIFSIID